ncbi:MAG: ABC transporter permease [Bacteroidales bacterium]|nr:ABC transporter permease [Bacteroidales bacterium]MBO7255833.1 ABC transporter permease [Bacteroidales bacterium]MBO7283926.1 ABC transporter permease [Bacteroidales bacterium]MBO7323141.1 ABC transporter permease [Bacteroidales bacterium]
MNKSVARFISFVGKEFNHILRDTRTLMVLLVMPVVMIVLFGFALSTELKNVKVGVYTPSSDVFAQKLISRIDASEYFTVVLDASEKEELDAAFLNNNIEVAIIFQENFYYQLSHEGSANVQILLDGTNMNIAQMAQFYLRNIIARSQADLAEEVMMNNVDPSWVPPVEIKPSTTMLYNPQMKSSFNFVPGVMGMILTLVCSMMTSVSIVREKERGTMEVLLVSPVKPFLVIIAKTIPYFVISAVNLATTILLAIYLLQVPVSGSMLWVVMISLLYIMVSLSLGILVSTLVSTQEEAILISAMVFLLPTLLLSGMLFPIESMPVALQYFSNVIPARWYIDAMKALMIQGVSVKYCLDIVLILFGFLIAITSFSVYKYKDRL